MIHFSSHRHAGWKIRLPFGCSVKHLRSDTLGKIGMGNLQISLGIHRNWWGNWIGFYSSNDVSWSEIPNLKFGWFRNKRNLSVFPFLKVCFWKCDFDDMASIMTSFFAQKMATRDENGIWTTTIFEKSKSISSLLTKWPPSPEIRTVIPLCKNPIVQTS